ncbi:bifunctional DNA primase/polymerase [Yinghuangia seranimata]|uniref:bifunctional DNA primase/polymerase n=1 Tax=Yinghuangia seranimata TaxID=408067 RepID=UPI00248CABEF|nr:bifunctional DNA primase/polymerase [Yinghuangia seranimata]MDI2128598.1 bifunctional DNA primase/polymerase [Yinghuangia seranimata]
MDRTDRIGKRARVAGWLRRQQREDPATVRDRRADLVLEAVRLGWPVCPAAHPLEYGCSCDRVGCPAPGMHPLSSAWQTQATTDPAQVARWLERHPEANFVTATGIAHDVLDVPVDAGELALAALGDEVGPVAAVGPDRYLFFTATRGTPVDEDEWWPCELDCHPETLAEHPGLRWHCRGSYVLLPPSRLPSGGTVHWLRGPATPLPDPLRVLDVLTDACDTVGATSVDTRWLMGM